MKVKIVKPDTTLFEGDAKLVQLPGTNGLFAIMENHAPIISSLAAGRVRIVLPDDKEQTFDINAGVVKGQQNEVLILVQ
ncbi:MAG: ATP synthase F1 subunit epsilon [Bacteroidales bacterium]|nr:ATP synthase F1 subunit epsilon [Bacteroidales bacterium]